MTSAFNRTLLSTLTAVTFVVAASVAAAAAPDSGSPSWDANAAAPAAGAQPSGDTSARTTDPTGKSSTGASSTTPAATTGAPADNPARRVFDQLDSNHDGMLSFDEFSRATIQRQQ